MYFSGILVLEPGSTCKVILERNRNLRKGLVFIHHGLGLHSNDISKPQGLRKEVLKEERRAIENGEVGRKEGKGGRTEKKEGKVK